MVVDRLVRVGVTECLCNICRTEQNFFSFEDRSYLTKLFILKISILLSMTGFLSGIRCATLIFEG